MWVCPFCGYPFGGWLQRADPSFLGGLNHFFGGLKKDTWSKDRLLYLLTGLIIHLVLLPTHSFRGRFGSPGSLVPPGSLLGYPPISFFILFFGAAAWSFSFCLSTWSCYPPMSFVLFLWSRGPRVFSFSSGSGGGQGRRRGCGGQEDGLRDLGRCRGASGRGVGADRGDGGDQGDRGASGEPRPQNPGR